jgi:hypothetical protein
MSTRGAKGAVAASRVGSSDGADAQFRQHVMTRYEALAYYRKRLVTLFSAVPLFYAAAIIATAILFTAPGLAPITTTFMPPFLASIAALIVAGCVSLRCIQRQNSAPWLAATAASTVLHAAFTVLYALAAWHTPVKTAEMSARPWWMMAALLHAVGVVLHFLACHYGRMITRLQEDKASKK